MVFPANICAQRASQPQIASWNVFSLIELEPEVWESLERPAAGAPVVAEEALAFRDALKARIVEAGHGEPTIMAWQSVVDDQSVAVNFLIDATTEVTYRTTSVSGGGWFEPYRFRKRLGLLTQGALNKGDAIKADQVRMILDFAARHWREQGYLEARIWLENLELRNSGQRVDVELAMERGPRYHIEEARITQSKGVALEELSPLAEGLVGEPLTQSAMDGLRDDLETYCRLKGFMGAQAQVTFGVDHESRVGALMARVDAGTTTTVGRVELFHQEMADPPKNPNGWFQRFRRAVAPRMADRVIEKAIDIQPGQPLDERARVSLERRLRAMGAFDHVDVSTRPTSDPARRDVRVEARDARSAMASVTGAINDTAGILGSAQLTENNWRGHGDRARIFGMVGSERANGGISFLNRQWDWGERLLGADKRPSLEWMARYRRGEYDDEYVESLAGGSVEARRDWGTMGRAWQDGWRLRTDYASYDPDSGKDAYEEDFDSHLVATLRYRLQLDTRDHPLLARSGTIWGTSLEAGMADGGLAKWTVDGERYQPLFGEWTWVSKGMFGLMPFDSDDVGLSERFFLGGASDMRGFKPRGAGPVDRKNDDLHVGGSTKALWQNEARYDFGSGLSTLGFVDFGVIGQDAFELEDAKLSVGPGLRYRFPNQETEMFIYAAEAVVDDKHDDKRSVHFGISFDL